MLNEDIYNLELLLLPVSLGCSLYKLKEECVFEYVANLLAFK